MKSIKIFLSVLVSVVLFSNAQAQIPSYVPTNGLVGYWPFNGNANDQSGNGHNGIIHGATLTSDRNNVVNSAYSYDGINDYIAIAHAAQLDLVDSASFSYWINWGGLNIYEGGSQSIIDKSTPSDVQNYRLCVYDVAPTKVFAMSNMVLKSSTSSIVSTQWTHVVFTFKAGTIKVYLNGNLDYSGSLSLTATNNDSLLFGTDNHGNNRFFEGMIDDIGIWNRALTAEEVTELYTAGEVGNCLPSYVPTDSLVGWWPFCGNAVDESGNGNNGVVNGAALTNDRNSNANSAYSFDGVNDYMICSNTGIPTTTAISISVWIKLFQNIGIAEYICLGSSSSTTWGTLAGMDWGGSPYQSMNYGRGCSGSGGSTVAVAPFLNTWQNITYVSSGISGTCDVYVNGVLIGQSINNTNGACSSSNLYFGVDIFGPNYINCELDDIGIWNRALTPCEVRHLYTGASLPDTSSQSISACNSYLWPVTGQTYTTSGEYKDTLSNIFGCDSIVTLHLAIKNSSSSTETITRCNSYTWSATGLTYTTGGTYTTTLVNTVGCDSLATLNLTITNSTSSTETITECDSYTWTATGLNYTTGGTYNATLVNSAGCDSLATLNLTILNSTASSQTATACNSYLWPVTGLTYTTSGTYRDTLVSVNGCDSVVTLNLTINNSTASTISPIACFSYTAPDGMIYTSSGNYTATISNSMMCDSVITINLTINTVDVSVTQNETTLTANASPASYQWVVCPSMSIISGATSQSYDPLTNGLYACIVTQNGCVDTTNCYDFIIDAVLENTFISNVVLYPNPTKGNLLIDLGSENSRIDVVISDVTGKQLSKELYSNTSKIELDILGDAGIYLISIESEKGRALLRVVKE